MHDSIDQLWNKALEDIFSHGRRVASRNGLTQEVIGWSQKLWVGDEPRVLLGNPRRKLSRVYAAAELLWYMSGDDSVEMIKCYAPQYAHFAEDDGRAHGAYGKRMRDHDQIERAIRELLSSPISRQCVIGLWDRRDDMGSCRRDLPCTLTWQLLVRDERLHMITTMRSNDVWLGMPYDVYVNCCVMMLLAHRLNVRPGSYTHNAGSLHLYEKNHGAAFDAWGLRHEDSVPVPVPTSHDEEWQYAVGAERLVRTTGEEAPCGHPHVGDLLQFNLEAIYEWHREKKGVVAPSS